MSRLSHAAVVPLALCALVAAAPLAGCAGLSSSSSSDRSSTRTPLFGGRQANDESLDDSKEFSWSDLNFDNLGKTTKKLVGQGPNRQKAQELYREADDLFKQAMAADPRYKAHIFEMAGP
jgi:hypothetical protein